MRDSLDGALSRRSMGRLLGALFTVGGIVALYSTLLPPAPSNLAFVIVAGLIAVGIGIIAWLLPWERWPGWAPMPMLLCAFPLIAVYNHFVAEPSRYPVFFMLAFAWVGLAQPRGVALALTPIFAVSYLVPLVVSDSLTPVAASSLLFTVPAAVVMGEVLAWVTSDLRAAQRELFDQIEHSALHDPLTQLPNRALFSDRVTHAAAIASRRSHAIDVLFIDLDNFKTINDSLGHGAGDELLKAVAQRLMGCVRSSDTVARLGGDEFAVLLEPTAAQNDAELVAERIHDALRPAFSIAGRTISIGASIGIAGSESGPADGAELLRNADMAMYEAKAGGKHRSRRFRPALRELADRELALRGALPGALERDELRLAYQPIVDLATLNIVGVEALLRWRHPDFGDVPPLDFIPLADEIGLGHQLRNWVMRTACEQLRSWDGVVPARNLWLSVNVSARQLQSSRLASEIGEVLASTGIAGKRLLVEISEHELLNELDRALRSVRAIRSQGVRVAIDDFGTGNSALSSLHQLPIDFLKVDRSFVAFLGGSGPGARLAETVFGLGTSLGFDVVAEGIERPEQLSRLRQLKIRVGQGYLLARPMDAEAAGELLRLGRVVPALQGTRRSTATRLGAPRTQPAG